MKEEIGIFSYYNIKKYYGINNIYNPILLFKEYTNNQISDYVIHNITLESNDYHTYITKNDIIRLKENKICFISMNVYNNILFINLINLYENTDFTVRYYKINMESEQNLKLWNYIKSHTFINFIAFAFSYESNEEMCGYEEICNVLLIFSYSNSSDFNFYLDQYLYNKSFDNFVKINLTSEVRIENNIFGYAFSEIFINELFNCNNLKFYSSYTNNSINSNYNLSKNEIINLNLSINNYNEIKCVLKYRYIVIEPEVSIYNQHSNLTEGTNDINLFVKDKYIGRLTYYNIILNQSLTKNCENNCALCPTNNLSFCIFCNSNFSLLEDGTKNCSSNNNNNDDNNNENGYNNDIEITKTIVKKTKEEFALNMTNLINSIEIGKKYIIQGDDFNLTIKPTDIF